MTQLQGHDGSPYPVNSIYCIGRNYADHVKEMGYVKAETPVVFTKTTACLGPQTGELFFPELPEYPQHEVEMVLWLAKGGRNIAEPSALTHIGAIGVGIDLTLRSIQGRCKEQGHPWTWAKCFDLSALVSPLTPYGQDTDLQNLSLTLSLNGHIKQNGNTGKMLFSCAKIIALLSQKITLCRGDLIYTGTPQGVGEIAPDQTIEVSLGDFAKTSWRVKRLALSAN
jgi:2-keto-4-pentenoate hydratase/2-oxohepta-3-ene-1,7-dioic acid hydratase in catechol pathway